MRKKWPVPSLIGVLGLIGTITVSLATNAASAASRWPGPIDLIRRYPWIFLICAVIAVIIYYVVLTVRQNKNIAPDTIDRRSIDISQSTFNGPVNLVQGSLEHIETSTESRKSDTEQKSAGSESQIDQPIILHIPSAFLESGDWEDKYLQAVSMEAPDAIRAQFIPDDSSPAPGVVAIFALMSSAQAHIVRKKVIGGLRRARMKYPAALIALVAVGKSDKPVNHEAALEMLSSAGCESQNSRVLICETEDDLRNRITATVRVAVSNNRGRMDLERMVTHLESQEKP